LGYGRPNKETLIASQEKKMMKAKAICDGIEFRIYEEDDFDKEFNREVIRSGCESDQQEFNGHGLPPCRYCVDVHADREDLLWSESLPATDPKNHTEEWGCNFYCQTLSGAKRAAQDEMVEFYKRHPGLEKKKLACVEKDDSTD